MIFHISSQKTFKNILYPPVNDHLEAAEENTTKDYNIWLLLQIFDRLGKGSKKKSWNFPIGGGEGGPKIKKNFQLFKNSAILLRMP